MKDILAKIRLELTDQADEKTKSGAQRFFKEGIKLYGVKSPLVLKIAQKYWPLVKTYCKPDLFGLCEEMLSSGYMEEAGIVNEWLPRYMHYLEPNDLGTFKGWIDCYIDNWAKCDGFCNHTVGDLIQKYPQLVSEVKTWAKSPNRWLKRAAAVSLIVPAKRGMFLTDALEICDVLLTYKDDMVQKGYGWLLKEESRMHQNAVFEYVVANRAVMPRTALRYAIELMPKELRAEAMKKN